MYVRFVKPALDRLVAVVILIILSPLLSVITVLIALFLGIPVFFRQTRPGLRGNSFTIYKFRTMTNARDPEGNLLELCSFE